MPLGLFVFTLLYGGMTVLAGFLAYKQSRLWPSDLAVESGIFAFLLLVVISSTIAQLYGREMANRIVWWGFLPLAMSIGLMTLVLALPASPEMIAGRPGALEAFELVHGQFWRVVASGPVAYLVSLLLNILLWRIRHHQPARRTGHREGDTEPRACAVPDYLRRSGRQLARRPRKSRGKPLLTRTETNLF